VALKLAHHLQQQRVRVGPTTPLIVRGSAPVMR
jgi:hypothetical protein